MLGIKMANNGFCGFFGASASSRPWEGLESLGRLEVQGYLDSPNVLWLDSAHSELLPRFLLVPHTSPICSLLLLSLE